MMATVYETHSEKFITYGPRGRRRHDIKFTIYTWHERESLQVNPGSLAEQAGLKTGDMIVRIGGAEADNMKHKEAQDAIVRAGNYLELAIAR